MQLEGSERSLEVDFNNLKLNIDIRSPSPPSHTFLPSESTDSTTSSACSSSPETTPETTPDGSFIAHTFAGTVTSTDTITSSPTTTISHIPIPPIPSNSTPTLGVPTPVPRRHRSTGILMTSNNSRLRSTSLPGSSISLSEESICLNVKFAPLPELAPRRRKSNVPLGVAARGQLMRRKRAMMYGIPEGEGGSPMWTEEETDAHLRRQMESQERKRISLIKAMQEEENMKDHDDVEDPFITLGRFMKGAWKKMSGKEKTKGTAGAVSSDVQPPPPEKDEQKETGEIEGVEARSKTSSTIEDEAAGSESGTGNETNQKDWQTETIVDTH